MPSKDRPNATSRAKKLLQRNATIERMRLEGQSVRQIAETLGLHPDTVKVACRELEQEGIVELKDDHAEETAWALLRGYELARYRFMAIYNEAQGNHAARVGALKGYVDVLSKEVELRQHLRILPRDLGQIAVVINMRHVHATLEQALNRHMDVLTEEIIDDLLAALDTGVDEPRTNTRRALPPAPIEKSVSPRDESPGIGATGHVQQYRDGDLGPTLKPRRDNSIRIGEVSSA